MKDFHIENGCLKEYIGADKEVVIPNGVTSIGKCAFFRCKSLKSVIIPDGVMSNVSAILLEYKNDNLSNFDPMDEFSLDW